MLYRWQLYLFQFLEDISPLIQEVSSISNELEGSLQSSQTMCGSVLTESLKTHVSSEFQHHWGHLWVIDLTGIRVGC